MKDKPIRWPKPKSEADLRRLKPRQVIEYARRLHVAWAEKHRREMSGTCSGPSSTVSS